MTRMKIERDRRDSDFIASGIKGEHKTGIGGCVMVGELNENFCRQRRRSSYSRNLLRPLRTLLESKKKK